MKNRVRVYFFLIVIFSGLLLPFLAGSSSLEVSDFLLNQQQSTVSASAIDPSGIGKRVLMYSENTMGENIPATINWELWSGIETFLDENLDPYEGTSGKNLTVNDGSWGWGLGLEISPTIDLSEFHEGYLIFSIKTDYSGIFQVGFQSPDPSDSSFDAFIDLIPGEYGYNNDSVWHQVIIPIVKIEAANNLIDLTDIMTGFVLYDDLEVYNTSIYLDDIYWQTGSKAIIYSETTEGDSYEEISIWNNWVGTVTIEDCESSAFEGNTCKNVTPHLTQVWWGMGAEQIPRADFRDFIEGLLIFHINTTYEGDLRFGMQTGIYGLDHSDQLVTVSPGEYGYQNDGEWHQVIIPIQHLINEATGVEKLDQVANGFVMMGAEPPAPIYDTPIFLDDIYWQAAVKPQLHNRTSVVYSESTKGDNFLATMSMEGWNGTATVTESTVEPYEGSSCIEIIYVDNSQDWWGMGLTLSQPENMYGYQGGTINLMIKTGYQGSLLIGFQTEGENNATVTLSPGLYGYNNDSLWNRISLPIDELLLSNADVDLNKVTNSLILMTEGSAGNEPVYIDNIYWTKFNFAPYVRRTNLEYDLESKSIEIFYSYGDYEYDPDRSEFRWFKNGTLVPEHNDLRTLPASALNVYDIWWVEIIPFDGFNEREAVVSNWLRIPASHGEVDTKISGYPITVFLIIGVMAFILPRKRLKDYR